MHVQLPQFKTASELVGYLDVQAFGQGKDTQVSPANLARFMGFLDYAITHDGNFAAGDIVNEASSYLQARFYAQQALPTALVKRLEALKNKHTSYAAAALLPKGFEQQHEVISLVATTLQGTVKNLSKTSSWSTVEQSKLLSSLIEESLKAAHSNGNSKSVFSKTLTKLINEHKDKLSQEGLAQIGLELNQANNEARVFQGLHQSIHGVILPDIEAMTTKEVTELSDTEKQIVEDAIIAYAQDLEEAKNFYKDDKQAQQYAENLLRMRLREVEIPDSPASKTLIAKREGYFKYLQAKHKELGQANNSHDFISALTKSFPNLVMPGMLGALIGSIFGSSFVGAALTIVIDILGNLDKEPVASAEPTKRPAPPERRATAREIAPTNTMPA